MLIKYIYILFTGILLAVFIGVGIAAFYKAPVYPEYPAELKYQEPAKTGETEAAYPRTLEKQKQYDELTVRHQKDNETYNRNVSIIATIASIIMVVLSLSLFRHVQVITDGLLLGGVLTLGYAVIRGFGSNDDMFRFFVVSVGLLVSLTLGYVKFVKDVKK